MSPEERDLIIEETLKAARAEVYWRLDTCVLSCSLVHGVLAALGLKPKYRPVKLEVFNPAFVEAATAGIMPTEMDPAKCRVVAAGHGGDTSRGGWDGHLVLIEGDVLIDPSLDQCTRPEYGIHLEPSAFVIDPVEFDVGERIVLEQNGSVICYVADPGNQRWRNGPDWLQRGERVQVESRRRIRAHVERKLAEAKNAVR